jgi:Crp-like helix-turn-helix domain
MPRSMSDALGLSVPHLNRTLAKLRMDGLISINGRHVEFADLESLELLGHFQPLNLTRVPLPPNQARPEPRGGASSGRPSR